MKQLVYAILAADDLSRTEPGSGLEGAPVMFVVEGKLAAACSSVAIDLFSPSASQAIAYAQVVNRLHQQSNILPLRLGCVLTESAAVSELLRVRCLEFTSLLSKVDGCVEMGVRVLPSTVEDSYNTPNCQMASVPSGKAYLLAKQQQLTAREQRRHQASEIGSALQRACTSATVYFRADEVPADARAPFGFGFLVRRSDLSRFHEAFQSFKAKSKDRLLLTGPWPPYSFVTTLPKSKHSLSMTN